MNRRQRRAAERSVRPTAEALVSALEHLMLPQAPARRVWLSPPVPEGTTLVAVRREPPRVG